MYKDLQLSGASSSEGLTKEEFEHLYECLGMKWELVSICTMKWGPSYYILVVFRSTGQAVQLYGLRV